MAQSRLTQRPGEVLQDLFQLSAERARDENSIKATYASATKAADAELQQSSAAIKARYEADRSSEEARYQKTRAQILSTYQTDHAAAEAEYLQKKRSIIGRAQKEEASAKKKHDDTRWEAGSIYEAGKDNTKKQYEKAIKQIGTAMAEFELNGLHAKDLLERTGRLLKGPQAPAVVPEQPEANAFKELQDAIARADEARVKLDRLFLPKLVAWKNYVWIMILLALGLAYPGFVVLGLPNGVIASTIAAIVLGIGLRFGLVAVARKQVSRRHPPLAQTMAEVETWEKRAREQASAQAQRQKTEITERRDREIQRAEEASAKRKAEAIRVRDEGLQQLEAEYTRRTAEVEDRRDRDIDTLETEHRARMAEIQDQYDGDSLKIQSRHKNLTDTARSTFEKAWAELTERWRSGLERVQTVVREIDDENQRLFLDGSRPEWSEWPPATEVPPAMRFGQFHVDMKQVPHGLPHDERLRVMTPEGLTFPALIPFPTVGSLLIKSFGPGREPAVRLLQAVMLQYLAALPPGKVRFTIVDPVGLGQNFSAFMHLADYDEQLVTSRIWTEPAQIEQRLVDLTDHMENVIQKYLRNEFETIEEYNIHAGEVAEPFRFLVIANFPVNFSEAACRRLISIATSGARCGVYTLISVDMQQQLPHGISLKELEQHAEKLAWIDQKYVWKGSPFEQYPLQLDAPPPPEVFNPLLQDLGAKAKAAKRVEVPFDYIAPAPDAWWTSDSSTGIDVPLGRAGATRLQHLKLGKGTSQHVLIAGRTGSGKSTLLHALITNLALHYSPEEVELYLIDFKKGVEFKTYATHELAHARVVAIESEREFGLSVLQRLDAELKDRGEKFREVGAQDLNAYRQANGNKPTPRILLIVDEFQEFFVEDDKVAQEASLLLDRLVRQGRAFGIHVHLGSQTLSGAYSLARSTLGQMAVRIALQCSESDAHLILSEENAAARLLSRPGEAIYNDANGLVEGNHPFQVVWLPEDRREDYLQRLHELTRIRKIKPPPQIIFEGNVPADATKNVVLNQLLSGPEWPESPRAARAWLGEAIAIKDPTEAVFRPQSGSNVMIIGQQDAPALGIMATALVSLCAQYPPGVGQNAGARFLLFDGSPVDSPLNGVLAKVGERFPHAVQSVGWRELPGVIGEVAEEVERRQTAEGSESHPIYLFVYDLQRFRDLRKADDDFGFSREEKPSPAKQFATIVRDGPPVGVHTIVWCDSLNNVNRALDRQTLREFEMRVLFQMSANDSSTLIDSPAANKLGPNRALLHSEEQGRLEKFRPYGIPSQEWLAGVQGRLEARSGADGATAPEKETTPVRTS